MIRIESARLREGLCAPCRKWFHTWRRKNILWCYDGHCPHLRMSNLSAKIFISSLRGGFKDLCWSNCQSLKVFPCIHTCLAPSDRGCSLIILRSAATRGLTISGDTSSLLAAAAARSEVTEGRRQWCGPGYPVCPSQSFAPTTLQVKILIVTLSLRKEKRICQRTMHTY